MYIYHFFRIQSSVDGYLGCFHILAIVNSTAMEKECFLNKYLEMELLDHMVALFLIFWRISICFFMMAAPIYMPTNSIQVFPFLYILSTCIISCFFDNNHSNGWEVKSHCGSDFRHVWEFVVCQVEKFNNKSEVGNSKWNSRLEIRGLCQGVECFEEEFFLLSF